MENYYIENGKDLKEILAERKSQTKKIQKMINEYVESVYGIESFIEITKKHFRRNSGIFDTLLGRNSRTTAMLLRQVSSATLEDISCFVTAKCLGMPIIAATLASDQFTRFSLDKMSRVKIPRIYWGRKGNLIKQYDSIVSKDVTSIEGKALSHIETKEKGVFLQDYHTALRKNVFGKHFPHIDSSSLLSRYLSESWRKPPDSVHLIDPLGYSKEVPFERDLIHTHLKPPASWYYPLYYLWFLDGSSVIFETYEESEGGANSLVRDYFQETVDTIKMNIGLQPLVVKICPAYEKVFYCSKHMDRNGLKKVYESFKGRDINGIQFPHFFEEVMEKVINYK